MPKPSIVIATPHHRYDPLVDRVRHLLGDYEVIRIRDREELTRERLEAISPLYIFFPHWSWLVPDEIYRRFECVVFHMTDLPYGRGGTPLQNLIVRGHDETVLSALRCVTELDAGPIYLKRALSLAGTAEDILLRAADLMQDMIVEIVHRHPEPKPQEGELTVFQRRRPEDGNLKPLDRLEQIYDYIRMLDAEGYPPAFLETEHFRFEFSGANVDADAVQAQVRIVKREP